MLSITPKSRQVTALDLLRQNWKQHRTLLLSAPVGFGKTAIAAFITDGFIRCAVKPRPSGRGYKARFSS